MFSDGVVALWLGMESGVPRAGCYARSVINEDNLMQFIKGGLQIPWRSMPLRLAVVMLFCGVCNVSLYYFFAAEATKTEEQVIFLGQQRLQAEQIALYSFKLATKPDFVPFQKELAVHSNALEKNFLSFRTRLAENMPRVSATQTGQVEGDSDTVENQLVAASQSFILNAQTLPTDAERSAKARDILMLAWSMGSGIDKAQNSLIQRSHREKAIQGMLLGLSLAISFVLIFWVVYRHFRTTLAISLAATEQRRNFLQEVVDSSFDAYISIDKDQRITLFNKEAEKLFDCPAEEVLGLPIDIFIPVACRAEHANLVNGFNSGKAKSKYMGKWRTVTALTRSKLEFPALAKITRHEMASGAFYSTVAIRDMRETMRQEKLIAQNIRQVERSNSRLKAFFAQFTHELRTPLNIIVGFTDLAIFGLSHASQDQTEQYLEHVSNAAKNLDKLILEVLEYRNIEEMVEGDQPEPVDVVAIMKSVGERTVSREEEKFKLACAIEEPLMVSSYSELLDLFFDMLFDLMVSKASGNITLEARLEKNCIVFKEPGPKGKSPMFSILEQLERVKNLQFDDVIRSSSPFEIRILTLLKLSEACGISVELDSACLQGGTIYFEDVHPTQLNSADTQERKDSIIGWVQNAVRLDNEVVVGAPANLPIAKTSKQVK
jgi:PAS domain S-box-containing protein